MRNPFFVFRREDRLFRHEDMIFRQEDIKTCFLDMKTCRHVFSEQDKHRRLWRPAVAPHPRMQANEVIAEHQSAPCPDGTRIHQKPTASSEGAQLWDNNPPHPLLVPRSGTDYHPQHHTGSVCPPSGNYMGWKYRTYPQLRCFAACSGFLDIGPAPRNSQLILNLLAFVAAWLRRDAIAS